jgi:predicted dehydrogenase
VICDKPVTVTVHEAEELERLVSERGVTFGLTHNYTGFPMVREGRKRVEQGALGEIQKVDVQYYMDAFNAEVHDPEKRRTQWRFDPEKSGLSLTAADLGTHAFNLAEYIAGVRVKSVLADLNTVYEDIPLDVDVNVLLRFENGARGVLCSSHIATGEDNNLEIKVYGRDGGLIWEEENPNHLHLLHQNEPAQILTRSRKYNSKLSLESSRVFRGLSEGFFEAFANIYTGVAKAIRGERYDPAEFPTISDGVRTMKFVEAAVASHRKGNIWVNLA